MTSTLSNPPSQGLAASTSSLLIAGLAAGLLTWGAILQFHPPLEVPTEAATPSGLDPRSGGGAKGGGGGAPKDGKSKGKGKGKGAPGKGMSKAPSGKGTPADPAYQRDVGGKAAGDSKTGAAAKSSSPVAKADIARSEPKANATRDTPAADPALETRGDGKGEAKAGPPPMMTSTPDPRSKAGPASGGGGDSMWRDRAFIERFNDASLIGVFGLLLGLAFGVVEGFAAKRTLLFLPTALLGLIAGVGGGLTSHQMYLQFIKDDPVGMMTTQHAIMTQGASFILVGLGVGLGLACCRWHLLLPLAATGALAGALAALLVIPIASVTFPADHPDRLLPDGVWNRLIWSLVPALLMAVALGRVRPKARAPAAT